MSEQTPTTPAAPARKSKKQTRGDRWREAASEVDSIASEIEDAISRLTDALADLRSIQEEFEDWKDNLPENLASSALGEKLETICGLEIDGAESDLESAISTIRDLASEAEAADIPLGFGRD
jgi:hypothetical protein